MEKWYLIDYISLRFGSDKGQRHIDEVHALALDADITVIHQLEGLGVEVNELTRLSLVIRWNVRPPKYYVRTRYMKKHYGYSGNLI